MTVDVNTRLSNLKAQIEEGKSQKARAEANKETYEKQLNEVKAEIESMGITPTVPALEAEIEKLDAEILEALGKAEGLLNPESGAEQ